MSIEEEVENNVREPIDFYKVKDKVISRLKGNRGVISDKPVSTFRFAMGLILLALAFAGVIYCALNYETLTEQKIIYPDGCEEIYRQKLFNEQKLVSDVCVYGREMIKGDDYDFSKQLDWI